MARRAAAKSSSSLAPRARRAPRTPPAPRRDRRRGRRRRPASRTAGCWRSTSSISAGATEAPLTLMSSLRRSRISSWPSSRMATRSPVRSQPSDVMAAAVACGQAVVALHDLGPADPQLARLPGVDVGARLRVDEPRLRAGHEPAGGPRRAGPTERSADGARRLGRSVALARHAAQALADGLLDVRGRCARRPRRRAEGSRGRARRPAGRRERVEERRGHRDVGDAVRGDELQQRLEDRAGEGDDLAPRLSGAESMSTRPIEWKNGAPARTTERSS